MSAWIFKDGTFFVRDIFVRDINVGDIFLFIFKSSKSSKATDIHYAVDT